MYEPRFMSPPQFMSQMYCSFPYHEVRLEHGNAGELCREYHYPGELRSLP